MTHAHRSLVLPGLLGLCLLSSAARAQYHYPPGYGGYGWHGWGGGAGSGRTAAGMGAFAAGAGQGAANLGAGRAMNAQARQTNAQTAMGLNDYLNQQEAARNADYYARMAQNLRDNVNAQAAIQDRILNHPNETDMSNGDALNAQLHQLLNPQVYSRALELAQKPLRSSMIKSLPFEYAAGGIVYSLADLTDPENVPLVFARPEFASARKTAHDVAAEMLREENEHRVPKRATIKRFLAAVTSAKTILERIADVDPADKRQAEKYLKALYGLTKMIDSPEYDVYLAAVDAEPTAPLCELLIFMHSFNLQFAPAKDPATREYYSMLYDAFREVRQALNAPAYQPPPPASGPKPRDDRAANFFGGMGYQHVMPPPAAEAR